MLKRCRSKTNEISALIRQKETKLRILQEKVKATKKAAVKATTAYTTVRHRCEAMQGEKREATCTCHTPRAGTVLKNAYSCTDGTTAACAVNQECYPEGEFPKSVWGSGCRVPPGTTVAPTTGPTILPTLAPTAAATAAATTLAATTAAAVTAAATTAAPSLLPTSAAPSLAPTSAVARLFTNEFCGPAVWKGASPSAKICLARLQAEAACNKRYFLWAFGGDKNCGCITDLKQDCSRHSKRTTHKGVGIYRVSSMTTANNSPCSGWTPSTGKWKGTGASCATWGWSRPWCFVSSDYSGPGYEFMLRSHKYPTKFFIACTPPSAGTAAAVPVQPTGQPAPQPTVHPTAEQPSKLQDLELGSVSREQTATRMQAIRHALSDLRQLAADTNQHPANLLLALDPDLLIEALAQQQVKNE